MGQKLPGPPKRYNPHYRIAQPKISRKLNLQKMLNQPLLNSPAPP